MRRVSGAASPQQLAEKVVHAQVECLLAEVVEVERLAVSDQDGRRVAELLGEHPEKLRRRAHGLSSTPGKTFLNSASP
jgi:hypothetical protein